jgi:hypothetical protein
MELYSEILDNTKKTESSIYNTKISHSRISSFKVSVKKESVVTKDLIWSMSPKDAINIFFQGEDTSSSNKNKVRCLTKIDVLLENNKDGYDLPEQTTVEITKKIINNISNDHFNCFNELVFTPYGTIEFNFFSVDNREFSIEIGSEKSNYYYQKINNKFIDQEFRNSNVAEAIKQINNDLKIITQT